MSRELLFGKVPWKDTRCSGRLGVQKVKRGVTKKSPGNKSVRKATLCAGKGEGTHGVGQKEKAIGRGGDSKGNSPANKKGKARGRVSTKIESMARGKNQV